MELFEPADLDHFRSLVGRHLGLQFDHGKEDLLADVLRQRLQAQGCPSPARYLASIAGGEGKELRTLGSHLTVTETYFFRGPDHFRALAEIALPERIHIRGSNRQLRLLSAGCASGEEPYSIAILLLERFPELSREEIEILGLDLNPAMIAKAKKARYQAWSLRETPGELREKYFRTEGADIVLQDVIRSMVSFKEQNLAAGDFPTLGQFDIILCRNVIMYLLPGAAQAVIGRLTDALAPQGFLFLGHAETLRGLSHDFHLRHTEDTFFYQKLECAGQVPPFIEPKQPTTAPPMPDLPDIAWVHAFQRAPHGSRIAVEPTKVEPARNDIGRRGAGKQAGKRSSLELSLAFELLRQEKFREALEVLHSLPPEVDSDPDARLLQAGLLVNCGELETAETVCRQILRADDLNAGAHYLTALCRERAGDLISAMEHDRAAIYLDDTFAMPHLHLGLLAKRSRDLATARRELEHACFLLLREVPSRLLLFGGGFNREALVAFGRAELRACGGSA